MIRGTTSTGFSFEVDEIRVNDMRVIDAMVEAEGGNFGGVSKLINLVLDPAMKKALYDHVRTDDGRVPIAECSKKIFEILKFDGETKNS